MVTDRKLAVDDGTGGVDYYVADVVSQSDYYPFGMMMPNRNETAGEQYRYGYQGSEMDNEVKGTKGTSYTTYFRQLDPRVGRWLSIDPMSRDMPWQTPFCSMDNSPVKFNDPLGDKVKKTNSSGDKKEFRRMKQSIRKLKRNSDSFKAMYKDMKKSDELFVFDASAREGKNDLSRGETTPSWETEDGSTIMHINGGLSASDLLETIAHETGHGWRLLHELDIQPVKQELPKVPKPDLLGINGGTKNEFKQYTREKERIRGENLKSLAKFRKQAEQGALHIENIVMSEMNRSSKKYSFEVDMGYEGGVEAVPYTTYNGNPSYQMNTVTYPSLKPATFYDNTINIHEEHNVTPIGE